MAHSHTVHLPLGALLSACTMCDTGSYLYSIAKGRDKAAKKKKQGS